MYIRVAHFVHRPTMHCNERLAIHKNPSCLCITFCIGVTLYDAQAFVESKVETITEGFYEIEKPTEFIK